MKKKKIFISSVQKEFAAERQRLFEYLHRDPLLGLFFEPFLFENQPAADQKTETAYIGEVAKSDIYIGLFGSEYGYEDEKGISPTEYEFNEASKQHKIRLIYIKGDGSLKRHPKMASLIQKVGLDVIRKRFNSEIELTASIYASLVKYLMEHEFIRSGPFDAAGSTATFEDIDESKVASFVARAKAVRSFPLSPGATTIEILTHLNLLYNNTLSNAAILLFGKNPQRFVLSSEVKCTRFHGIEVAKPIPSYQVYKGDVFALVDQSVDFVLSKLDISVGTRKLSNQVPTQYEIPPEVVSEAIVNAVAHRDYSSFGSVQVMLFADRLEVWNPGTLTSSLSLSQLKGPHGSFPVNPLLAEPMYLAGYIERMGTGTRDIVRLCKEANLKEPVFSLDDGFRTVIWRPVSASTVEASGEATEAVMEEVRRLVLVLDGEVKRSDIQEKLALKSDDFFRINYVLPALEAGFIEMTIPDAPKSPNQKYRLTAKGMLLKKETLSTFLVKQFTKNDLVTDLVTDQVTDQVGQKFIRPINLESIVAFLEKSKFQNKLTDKQLEKYALEAKDLSTEQIMLLDFANTPKSNNELQKHLGLKKHTDNFKKYIEPLLLADALWRTLPNVPNSPKQKYFTTEKGKILHFLANTK